MDSSGILSSGNELPSDIPELDMVAGIQLDNDDDDAKMLSHVLNYQKNLVSVRITTKSHKLP